MTSRALAPRPLPRRRRGLAVLALAALLAACGGGTQVESFNAARLVVFGDESSVLTGTGLKYGINALTDNVLDCRLNPLWVQTIATEAGVVFAECNPDDKDVTAFVRAAPGARVADVLAELADFAANGTPASRDLIALMVGANDVLDLYAQYDEDADNEAALADALRARGAALAAAINDAVRLGGPVAIIATVPDLGKTPYALREKTEFPGTDRAALLTRLTSAFNSGLRTEILNDGRVIGLVDAFEQVQAIANSPTAYGVTNATAPACANAAAWPSTSPDALLACTTSTLVANAVATRWLWADNLRLGPPGQSRLGSIAAARLRDNPF